MVAKRDFTDRFLRSIKPAAPGKRDTHWDAQVPGFAIRVTDKSCPEDVGAFVLIKRFPGSPNPVPRTIFRYPGEGGLAKGRQIAREWNDDLAKGIDPKVKEEERRHEEERRRQEEARRRADTFAAVFTVFDEDHLSGLRTGAAVKKAIERHVLPNWGELPLRDMRRPDVIELVTSLRKKTPIQANRVTAYLKRFFGWCVDRAILEASPAERVERPTKKESKRDRVLSDAEIKVFWEACGELGAFGRAFRLLLATGARLSEVGDMTWAEIDQDSRRWTIPRERTKADRSHELPLSDLALSILEECPGMGKFVFTTRGTVPISGWSKSKAALDAAMLGQLQKEADEKGDKTPVTLPDWRLHDLRRTCATNLARLGVDRIVISKILNHSEGGVTTIYDRHSRDPEKRSAMELWAQRLRVIISGGGADNVVSLTARRG